MNASSGQVTWTINGVPVGAVSATAPAFSSAMLAQRDGSIRCVAVRDVVVDCRRWRPWSPFSRLRVEFLLPDSALVVGGAEVEGLEVIEIYHDGVTLTLDPPPKNTQFGDVLQTKEYLPVEGAYKITHDQPIPSSGRDEFLGCSPDYLDECVREIVLGVV